MITPTIRTFLALLVIGLISCQNVEPIATPTPVELEIPFGFPDFVEPEDNPTTAEGVALGRELFYDPILSGDRTQACASCHNQEFAFTDNGNRYSVGIDGTIGKRSAPSIVNTAWAARLFWDGRSSSIEALALLPIPDPTEMHLEWVKATERLKISDNYPDLFESAFPGMTIDSILVSKAVSQFLRTIISGNSKFDQFYRGEVQLTSSEASGFDMFFTEKADCFHCHGTRLFTDNLFHNNGLDRVGSDPGLSAVSSEESDIAKFKTPTLRNIGLTAPYMHDGRFATLDEVIDFYSEGLQASETVDPLMKNVHAGGIALSNQKKTNLKAFLLTLTDLTFIDNPQFSSPK